MRFTEKKIVSYLLIVAMIFLYSMNTIAQTRIAILYSGYTEKFSDKFSPKIIDQITLWELFLMQEKIPYSVINDQDLEAGITDDYDILILPSVNAISEKEKNSMKEFLNDGNSILSLGSKLTLDEKGMFYATNNLNDLFGIECEEFKGEELSIFHHINFIPSFNNQDSLTGSLLISTKFKPQISNILSNSSTLGYVKINKYKIFQTSMSYGKSNNGKFVWMGFNFDDVIGGKNDSQKFKKLILNSLKWLDKEPDLWIKNFPDSKNSATVIFIENNYGLKPDLIDRLNKEGIEPYLLFSPEQKINEEIVSRFKEENYILDLSNVLNKQGDSEQKILDELIKANKKLNLSIKTVLISDSLINNRKTLNSLNETGINVFLFPTNSPGLPSMIDNKFFMIPYYSTERNNYDVGGVNFITYHSRVSCDDSSADDFIENISEAKMSESWVTNLQTLNTWWMKNTNISFSFTLDEDYSANLIVSNNNWEDVNNIDLIFNWPYKFNLDQLSVKSGNDIINYSVDNNGEINIKLDKIASHQTKRINIIFNREQY
jgi:hypothetical protein